jgi:hypothetical protein
VKREGAEPENGPGGNGNAITMRERRRVAGASVDPGSGIAGLSRKPRTEPDRPCAVDRPHFLRRARPASQALRRRLRAGLKITGMVLA